METAAASAPPWKFWLACLGAIVFFMVVAFGAILYVVVSAENREDREDAQVDTNQSYLSCLRGNELRQTQLENELEPGTVIDLTLLPSVANSPQWFKDLVVELRDFSKLQAELPPAADSTRGRRIARLQGAMRDCEREWPGHTPGLKLPHEASQ